MDISIFWAKFLGVYFLLIAALWILRRSPFEEGMKAAVSSRGCLLIFGLLSLIFGLLIVSSHSLWHADYRGLITFLGYLGVVKGIVRIGYPEIIEKRALDWLATGNAFRWTSLAILIALGLFLAWHGFGDIPNVIQKLAFRLRQSPGVEAIASHPIFLISRSV